MSEVINPAQPPPLPKLQSLGRLAWYRAMAALIFLVACFAGFNAAFLLGFVGVPAALWAFRGSMRPGLVDEQSLVAKRALLVLCGVLFLVGAPVSCSMQTHLLERSFEPTFAALASYRSKQGEYPGRLDALVPAYLPAVPKCPGNRVYYLRAGEGDSQSYVVICTTFAFHKHTYESVNRRWKGRD